MTFPSSEISYLFGEYELDTNRGFLCCGGKERPLRHQSYQLLLYLLERPGVLITKDQLTEAIWSHTSVTDNALVQCITEIRRTLHDDPRNPRFIKTVPKIGYRFIAQVQVIRELATELPDALGVAEPNRQEDVYKEALITSGHPLPLAEGPSSQARKTNPGSNLFRIAALIALTFSISLLCGDKTHADSLTAANPDATEAHKLTAVKLDGSTVRRPLPSSVDVGTRNVEAYRYYSLGVEEANQFQNRQAIALMQKAIEIDPKFAMAYARIGYAYAVMDFQPESANRYLKRASELSSGLPVLSRLYIDAWSAIARADYNTAIAVLQQITEQYPEQIEAYSQLSRVLRGQERLKEASTLLSSGIQKNPMGKDLYNNYGLILVAMGKTMDALNAYKRYVDLDPRNPNAHDSLGMAYQQTGQYSSALTEFNEALKLDPEFEPSIVHLGDAYYQLGQNQDAVREYLRYIQITTNSCAKAIGYGDLAIVYSAMSKEAEARKAASDELRYNSSSVWNSLVFALEDRRSDRVVALKERLFSSMPNPERGSPPDLRMAFYYRGYYALKTGDSSGAISYFKSALEHLPPSSGIDSHQDCLANAYLELGMYSEAIDEYQRILRLNAHYPEAYFHLGQAYRGLHNTTAAKDAFQHYLSSIPSADRDSPAVREAQQSV
ncbi:tetratricopeptide repeat protein [Granulicella paludicola]|uniref:tetratricopeptide repeat protein n=1 Tax=Granulicella paludicola TaxID=474951 RepID=UPI0021DFEC12|nr:tetratricopeptide repeat protein [Granulicella paludicola]